MKNPLLDDEEQVNIANREGYDGAIEVILQMLAERIKYLIANPEIEHAASKAFELAAMSAEIKTLLK